jgi:hypothetical protein
VFSGHWQGSYSAATLIEVPGMFQLTVTCSRTGQGYKIANSYLTNTSGRRFDYYRTTFSGAQSSTSFTELLPTDNGSVVDGGDHATATIRIGEQGAGGRVAVIEVATTTVASGVGDCHFTGQATVQ